MISSPSQWDRGSVWLVDFEPVRGHEQGRLRPAVIVSATSYNASGRGMLAVVPCTTTYRRSVFYVQATPPDGGLSQTSYIICDQVRTISAERFVRYLGVLDRATLRMVDERIRAFLDV